MSAPAFSAALLLGGRSRRMGTDKATLTHPDSRIPRWKHLTLLIESMNPENQFLSLRPGQLPPADSSPWQPVEDAMADAGPLGGIASCLARTPGDHLLVLAVDLIQMEVGPLQCLLSRCVPGRGAVFQHERFYEPLAAVYSSASAASALAFLNAGGRRLQTWVQSLVEEDQLLALPLPRHYETCFHNVNRPGDYPPPGPPIA